MKENEFDIPKSWVVPKMRRIKTPENAAWLSRNAWINNGGKENFTNIMTPIVQYAKEKGVQ